MTKSEVQIYYIFNYSLYQLKNKKMLKWLKLS